MRQLASIQQERRRKKTQEELEEKRVSQATSAYRNQLTKVRRFPDKIAAFEQYIRAFDPDHVGSEPMDVDGGE
jgi:hypothetical protein